MLSFDVTNPNIIDVESLGFEVKWFALQEISEHAAIRILFKGNKNDQPVVFISGFTLTGTIFCPIADLVVERNRRAIIVDPLTIYNLSLSELRKFICNDSMFTPFFYAKIVKNAIDAYEIQKVDLWGQSIGGHIALLIAQSVKEQIKSVILVNPVGIPHNFGHFSLSFQKKMAQMSENPKTRLKILNTVFHFPFKKQLYYFARKTAGNPVYQSKYLQSCINELLINKELYVTGMVMPILSMNKDILDDESIAMLRGLKVYMINSVDDKMLLHTFPQEESNVQEEYKFAWVKKFVSLKPTVFSIEGGHESMFKKDFPVKKILDKIF